MMKNRNLNKLLVLVLSVALLVCAAVGISAVANENAAADPTVSVVGYVADYDGEAKIAYYVTTANAENLTAKLVLGTVNVGDTLAADAGKVAEGELTVDGETPVTLDVFYSDGVDPKDFRDDITATVVLVDADNKVVAAAAAITTTVYDSSMTLFNGGATEAQLKMHTLLLKYAAAVQAVVDPDSESADYKWADEIYIVVDGENTTGYRANLLDTYEAPIATADRFDADGKYFTGWTDAEGEAIVGWLELTVANLQPGTTTLVRNYEALEGYESFDGDALPENVTFNRNDTGFANVADGTLAFGKVDDVNNGSNVRFAADRPGVYATEYIFETDFNIESWDLTQKQWVYKFCLWAAGTGNNAEMTNITPNYVDAETYSIGGVICKLNTWHHLTMVVAINDGILTTTFTVDGKVTNGGFQASITQAGEYRMLEAGVAMRDSTFHDCANTTLLLDNTAVKAIGDPATYTVTLDPNGATLENNTITVTAGQAYELPTPESDAPFIGWYSEAGTAVDAKGTWTYIGDHTTDENKVQYYNGFKTLVAKWAEGIKVTLDGEEVTVYSGMPYEFATPVREGLIFGGWVDADGNLVANAGTWPVEGATEVELTSKWYVVLSESVNNYDDGTASNVNFNNNVPTFANGAMTLPITKTYIGNIFNLPASLTGVAAGSKYIYETDFTYNGITASTVSSADGMGWVGFLTTAGNSNGNMIQAHMMKYGTDDNGDGIIDYISVFGQKYYVGEKVTLRIEYVVGENVSHLYHDGVYIGTTALNGGNDYTTKNDVTTVSGFSWHFRSTARFGDVSFTFDNTKVQVLTAPSTTSVTLDANGGTLPEGAANTYSYTTGDKYTLPVPVREGYAFAGWYNGDVIVATNGSWTLDVDATLTAKWLIASTVTCPDYIEATRSKWSGDIKFATGNTNDTVDAVGTKYTFTMKYTYNGLTAFTLAEDGTVTGNAGSNNYGFPRLYSQSGQGNTAIILDGTIRPAGNFVNAAGEIVVADGKLVENSGITADTEIFYSQLVWQGMTFEIGVEYDVTFEITMNGVGTAPTIVLTAVDANGNVQTKNPTPAGAASKTCATIYEFALNTRSVGTYSLTQTITNAQYLIETPIADVALTLDATGGTLPEGAAAEILLSTGAAYELPTPVAEGYVFAGWYNGDELVAQSGNWNSSVGAELKAKWIDTTVCTYDDMEVSKSDWSNNIKWVIDGYDAAVVDAAGTKYVYNTKYTYKGMTNFAITDGVVAPVTEGASEAADKRNFGFPRIIGADATGVTGKIAAGSSDTVKPGGKYVNAEGVVVVDETGKLLDEFATLTADQIFYETLTWGNMTFKIGVEYDLTITAVMGADSKFAVTAKAVAADGTVDEGSLATSNAVVNIQHFYMETRGAKYTGAYTVTHSFTDTTFTKTAILDSVVQAPVVEETPEETPAE